jgi:predicted dehydrogenase
MTRPKNRGPGRIRVALAGMRFGAAFVPIYLHHPDVEYLGIVDPDRAALSRVGDQYDVARRHESLDEVLCGDEYDAVHLVTPIPLHAQQSVAVLNAGKHCACTVPMATSLSDLRRVVAAQRRSGRKYMMMETAVYTRQFLYARELVRDGRLGRIQFLRGAHYQDMENWPSYWMGLPPMWYATHAIAPCLALAGTRAVRVYGLGSGWMRRELHRPYGNPYPVESAVFELASPALAMEVTRSLFHTSRGYTESFCVYGEKMTFEWPQLESEDRPVVFTMSERPKAGAAAGARGLPNRVERIEAPDRQDLLPKEIARFTVRGKYDDTNPQKSFETGGGHHGSHPHLVHEFIRSIVEDRTPWVDAVRGADRTAAGICAHHSAMKGGRGVTVPSFA